MEWIPEFERDSAWPLFNVKFLCRVPYLESRSPEDLRMFGMPHTGITEYDQQTANELVHRLLTIKEIMDYFDKDVSVFVCNRADTKKIYEIIRTHLTTWEAYLRNAFDTRGAPIDDLVHLDKLAQVVYQHAVPFITEDNASMFAQEFNGIRKRRGLGLSIVKEAAPEPAVEEKQYESMARAFVNMRRERG